MTGKRNRLFRSTGWFALCLVTSAVISFADSTNRSPVIFPNGEGTNASGYRLVWPTDPGVRYQPQQSPDLLGWTTLGGYPRLGPGLADQYLFNATSNRQFFRVLQLDEQPPVIAARYPDNGGFAVPRQARLTVNLADQSAIDPASLRLTVGILGEFTTNSPQLAFTNNTLLFDPATVPLGAYGEKVNLSLVAADKLGNRATNAWSFDLEVQPQVATNLFVFGSVQAQKSGQRIGNIPTAVLAGRSGTVTAMNAGAQPWTLASVAADRLVVAYTGSSAPAITVGAYLSNLTPANTNEIFYRQVTSINDDAVNKRLTVFTMDVTLESLVQQGSLSVSSDSMVLNVGEGGAITKAVFIGGTVAFPRIGFSLDGTEFKLKGTNATTMGTNEMDIIKLTAEELHWWLTPKLSVAMDLSWGKLNRFEAVASGNIDSAMVFNLDVLLLGMRQEYVLYALPEALKPSIWMYLGNIGLLPVYATLSFDIKLKATPEAKAFLHFEYGLRQDIDMAFGLHYENSQVDWIKTCKFAPTDVVPFTADITGELSLELSLEPQLEFLVYGLAGVSAGITPSGTLAIKASTGEPPIKATLGAAVSLDLGLNGPALDFLKFLTPEPQLELSISLWSDEWLLYPKPASISIQTQPQSQTVRVGDSAYFMCSASAADPISYQWYQRGVPLPRQRARTLLLPYVTTSHAGDYYVSLQAGSQKTNSTIATLTVIQDQAPAPTGMALIPAGSFTMGDTFGDGSSSELPLHTVYVSAFYMDKMEVTKALWDEVYQWAVNRPVAVRYAFDNAGLGKASNHPVHTVNWYDMVKWCNARSEKEGRIPAYYTSAAQATVYRTGQVRVQNDWVKWSSGYRLPTEAEWEKAARGGTSGQRFPWSNVDTITHSHANYFSDAAYSYDLSSIRGYHPSYDNDPMPYTSPVGSFAANGYGLYDMAGNVFEWCWDWYGSYFSGAQTEPRGPASGSSRVFRGGGWYSFAYRCRVAYRDDYGGPGNVYTDIGFRSALPVDTTNGPPNTNSPSGMVWIEPGTFTMGSPTSEADRDSDEVQHSVTISKGYWMGKYQVTQGEYLAVMGSNPSWFTGDLQRPVEQVTWYDATNYCGKLTQQERAAGRLPAGYSYRLPTEAEWEYACRAGTTTRFSYGDDLGYTSLQNYAWYWDNSYTTAKPSGGYYEYDSRYYTTHPVGQKLANPWGLYDMHGNIWQWCMDWFVDYPSGSVTDPQGLLSGVYRVVRGGGWNGYDTESRSANRAANTPSDGSIGMGFRPVLAPGQ